MQNIKILHSTYIALNDTSYNLRKALKHYKAIPLLLIMIIILNSAACGRKGESSDANTCAYDVSGPRPGDTSVNDASIPDTDQSMSELPIDRSQFYGETLVIYALSRNSNSIATIADEYMRQNPSITIDIIGFGGNLDRARQETSIALGDIALPAGAPPVTSPVLIESTLVNPNDTHHFVNWTPFIDATPYLNDHNFFMNVINAMKVEGFLYEFPLTFLFDLIAANHTIPYLTQAMETYEDGITMYQLLGIMLNFNTTGYHPFDPDQPMYLLHNFDVGYGFESLHDCFNSETGTAEFNNQRFIDFLNHAREATYPDRMFGEDYAPHFVTMNSPDWAFVIWKYFFINIRTSISNNVIAFRTNHLRSVFSGATPIISSQGALIIIPAAAYVLSVQATPVHQDLAWDFIQFMASVEGSQAAYRSIRSRQQGNELGGSVATRERLPMIPVNRDAARFTVSADWPATGNFCNLTFMLTGTINGEVAIPLMNDWLDDISDMPMVLAQTWPDAVRLTLQDFHNGAISAADAAVLIQDLIEFESVRIE